MSIIVSCSCGQSFRAKPELAGRSVKCPSCGSPLQIPQSAPAAAVPAALDDPLGLGGLDDRNLGAPLPQTAASRPLQLPARSYSAPKRKQNWGPILRIVGIAGGIVAGFAVLAAVGVALWMFLGASRSPEAVFEAAKAAAEQQDWEGFCECLTPEERDERVAMLLVSAVMVKRLVSLSAIGGPGKVAEAEEKFRPILDVLYKHGLDEPTLKSAQADGQMRPGRMDRDRVQQLISPIENRNLFIADMISALPRIIHVGWVEVAGSRVCLPLTSCSGKQRVFSGCDRRPTV